MSIRVSAVARHLLLSLDRGQAAVSSLSGSSSSGVGGGGAGAGASNAKAVADVYAEVVGVLSASSSRFSAVKKRFLQELNEWRHAKDVSASHEHNIISVLNGMQYFRIKVSSPSLPPTFSSIGREPTVTTTRTVQTHPMEELETGIAFLHELGQYLLEVKQREIKHHIWWLLVKILLPFASVVPSFHLVLPLFLFSIRSCRFFFQQINTETNIPSLISFVDLLFTNTLDLANKRHHKLVYHIPSFPDLNN